MSILRWQSVEIRPIPYLRWRSAMARGQLYYRPFWQLLGFLCLPEMLRSQGVDVAACDEWPRLLGGAR